MDLYIYYRVRSSDADALHVRAAAMQTALADKYGIVGALKRRPEEKEGRQTWMEVYEGVPEDFEASLKQAVTDADLPALIDGARHTEYFMDVSSCA
jgi:hypothetical protein